MKRTVAVLSLSLIGLAAAGCGRVEARLNADDQVTMTRSWPAAGIDTLKVFEINGSISVEGTNADQITLVATAHGDLDRVAGAENQGLFQTAVDGNTLSIGRKKHRRSFNVSFFFNTDDDMRIDYVLKVPTVLDVDASTVNGRISTRGIEGETEATTVNGKIDLESTGVRELSATTVNGKVRARFTRGFSGARFKTVNGGVEAILPPSASFDVDLSQVNGDFDASFPLSIHSGPGRRRVSGEVNGGAHRLRIVTVNGDIQLRRSDTDV